MSVQARDDEIAALKVQLAEFQPLAEAVAGARAGVGMTSGVQELARTGLADVPAWGRGLASGSALHVQPTETQLRPFWCDAKSVQSREAMASFVGWVELKLPDCLYVGLLPGCWAIQ